MFAVDLALRFWKPIAIGLAVLAIVLAAGALKRGYDDGKRAEGAAPVQEMHDAYVKAARERTTAITLAWDQKRIEAEAAGKAADDERARRIAESKKRAAALPAAVAAVVVPAAALELLDDAIRTSDRAETPGSAGAPVENPPAVTPAAAEPDGTVGLLTAWGLEVVALYDACRDQVTGWQGFYRGLQAAQTPEP